ncbi:isochorismatase family protein [Pseudomonas fluorescens]|nr:isochorismatase family protein [Pseudomonas fluorescens]
MVIGVFNSCCVETTAREAANRGYGCILVSDTHADCDEAMYEAAILNFGLYFGKVSNHAEELLMPLTPQAGPLRLCLSANTALILDERILNSTLRSRLRCRTAGARRSTY